MQPASAKRSKSRAHSGHSGVLMSTLLKPKMSNGIPYGLVDSKDTMQNPKFKLRCCVGLVGGHKLTEHCFDCVYTFLGNNPYSCLYILNWEKRKLYNTKVGTNEINSFKSEKSDTEITKVVGNTKNGFVWCQLHEAVIFKKVCSRNNSLIAVHKRMPKFTAGLKCFFIAITILLSGQFLGS